MDQLQSIGLVPTRPVALYTFAGYNRFLCHGTSLNQEPTGTVYYRSQDALENFKLRIRIRKVVFGTAWDVRPSEPQDDVSPGLTGVERSDGNQQDESTVFSWQEKIFSQRELEIFRDPNNCLTVYEKAAHEKIVSMTAEERQKHGHKLFSRVDADMNDIDQAYGAILDDPAIPETYLADRMPRSAFRPRKPKIADISILQRPGGNVIGFFPTTRRIGMSPAAVMYLLADLSSENQNPDSSEEADVYLLCTVRVDNDGLIAVEPDFNALKKPYLIQMERGNKGMYEYFIEDASDRMSRTDIEHERQIFQALYRRNHEANALVVGRTFDEGFSDGLRASISGEIVYAEDFEYDNVFVHFLLQLPPEWTPLWDKTEEPTHWTTQMAQQGKDKKWTFRCPFEWDCRFELNGKQHDQTYFPSPKILFEIVSLDSWNRCRVEGYGSLSVPMQAGLSDHLLNTWRPVGYTLISRLRRFFIGGSPELDDMTFTSIPLDFQDKELSKYGFQTVPSGKLLVRLQVVLQQSSSQTIENTAVVESEFQSTSYETLPDFSRYDDSRGVEDVLKAFKRARNRLLAARGLSVIDDDT